MTPKRIEPFLEATPGCLDFFLNLTPESPAACPRERSIQISMDGRGRAMDNVFNKRL